MGEKFSPRLIVKKTSLDGVLSVTPSFVFSDARGSNHETYNLHLFREAGVDILFVQDSHSVSRFGVLRGVHGDEKTWKLLSCPYGRVFVGVVNHDPDSPEYRKSEGFELSDRNRQQLLVPPKFGNGHLVLSDLAIFAYKLSEYTDSARQFTLRWDSINLRWPLGGMAHPILSDRDQNA